MGDLMNDTKEFSTLITDYKNFLTPAMKIKVDGSDIQSALKVGVTNLNVTLELDDASSANFTVTNLYDLKSSSIASNVKSSLKLGATVSIELGYESKLTEVFQGYIANLSMDFSDMPGISVTALDIRSLMRTNKRSGLQYTEKKYSDVVKKVLGAYKKLCPKLEIDATTVEDENIMQNESDFEFIKKVLGRKAKKEFLVLNDTAYFRDFAKSKEAITTLERGKGLISFSGSLSYCNEELIVYGHDDKKNEGISVKKTAKSDSAVPALVTPTPVREIQDSDSEDKDSATNFAEFELNERLKKSQTGRGTCIGLPEIVPGRYIKVDKLDALVNKTYYLKQVTHSFGGDGYTTDFEIGGWK
jgi:phage protein D